MKPKAALMELSGVSSAVIKGLEKKGILDIYKKEIRVIKTSTKY